MSDDDVYELTAKTNGPTSILLVGVHGDERCGVDAVSNLLKKGVEVERGRVLICYGNPRAIKENRRFIDANLNRMFKENHLLSEKERGSYEYFRAQFLKTYLNQAEALLDIHASNTPNSKAFAISEDNGEDLTKYLPVDIVVSGFDQVEPGGTDYYMNRLGRVGITLECGFLGDPQSTRTAEKGILAFLKARGHVLNDINPSHEQLRVCVRSLYITKAKFTLSKSFGDFEEVVKSQPIGLDGDTEVRADKDGVIIFARNRMNAGEEAFLLGDKEKRPYALSA